MTSRLIFTNGCFDLLHVGHVRLLKFARSIGSELLVGLNSDSSIRKLKGSTRPIIGQDQRAEMLRAVRWVDSVELFDDDNALRLLQRWPVLPYAIVKGAGWQTEQFPERQWAEQVGVKVLFYPRGIDVSTSQIIERIHGS